MTLGRVVRARLTRLWVDLRSAFTLRRTEKRFATYALRLLCLGLILVVLPLKKAIQLGALGTILALIKAAFAAALVVGALAAYFAMAELMRRRAAARRGREAAA